MARNWAIRKREPRVIIKTCLALKKYQGIGGAGDITYKFKYDNSKADCPYRVMRAAQDSGEVLSFQETLVDGTTTKFEGQVSVKRTGGGVNGVIEFNLAISLQSNLTVTDPE